MKFIFFNWGSKQGLLTDFWLFSHGFFPWRSVFTHINYCSAQRRFFKPSKSNWLHLVFQLLLWERSFFQAAVVSILLYGCTTWTLTKRMEKKLEGNYARMLRAILNESWRQHPTSHQLYGHLPPITKTIKVRRTRHVGHCWRSREDFISDVLL